MNHIKPYYNFITESVNIDIDLFEDCFSSIKDEYSLLKYDKDRRTYDIGDINGYYLLVNQPTGNTYPDSEGLVDYRIYLSINNIHIRNSTININEIKSLIEEKYPGILKEIGNFRSQIKSIYKSDMYSNDQECTSNDIEFWPNTTYGQGTIVLISIRFRIRNLSEHETREGKDKRVLSMLKQLKWSDEESEKIKKLGYEI